MADLLKALQSVAALVVLVGGGWWGLQKWRVRREHDPRLEFLVDVVFVGTHLDQWVVELVALVENKGMVQHTIRQFAFDLRALDISDPLEYGGEEINHQLRIPRELLKGCWIPGTWDATFIRPGLRTRYSFVASAPKTARFLLLHGRFDYGERSFHTADKLVAVPAAASSAAAGRSDNA